MTKRARQYIGLLTAAAVYYLIHEGAHLLYALATNSFKTIHFMGMGIQIDIHRTLLSDAQLAIFCLVGVLATQLAAYGMVALKNHICRITAKLPKTMCYYITIALLMLDPLYLSLLCGMVGGGDMNGIALLIPEPAAGIAFGILLIVNGIVFWKAVLPCYQEGFKN